MLINSALICLALIFVTFSSLTTKASSAPKPLIIKPIKPQGHVAGQSIDIEHLLPETGNPSSFLVDKLLASPPPPPADCKVDACIALSFDDGPNADSSPLILNTLEKYKIHASFFLIGLKVAPNTALVRRMYTDGDDVGNHSWSHPDFTKLNVSQIQQQIDLTQNAITVTGIPAPYLFRPPYGAVNPAVLSQIKMAVILWNVDPKDWAQKDTASVIKQVETQVRPGAILVMHDHALTALALDSILRDLTPKYKFVNVGQLLNLQSNSQGLFFGR